MILTDARPLHFSPSEGKAAGTERGFVITSPESNADAFLAFQRAQRTLDIDRQAAVGESFISVLCLGQSVSLPIPFISIDGSGEPKTA